MNSFNFEKFIPSFGSEILDELYKETPIIETSFEDFLKLPTIEGYKKNAESKIEEIKTEEKEPEMLLGITEKDISENIVIDDSK